MDALDEFFSTWCAPEAWCEKCGEHPALYVLRRSEAEKYGGFPTYVRVWDSAKHAHLAMCRQCVKQQVNATGEAVRQPVSIERRQAEPSWLDTLRRFLRYSRYQLHLRAAKLWGHDDTESDIPKTETL